MYKYYEIHGRGHNVRCKLYYNDLRASKRAVVFCTGFAGHKDNHAAERFSEKLLSKYKDVMVLVFNWPAHGDDIKKKILLADCDTYLELVIGEIHTRFGISELYAYATSFGGYLLLKYISGHGDPFRRAALRCPAIDMYDILTHTIIQQDELELIMNGKEAEAGFDRKILVTKDFLEALKANDIRSRDFLDYADDILILHGTKDEVVPMESSKTFAEDQVIEFIPVENADHRFQNPAHMDLANKYVMDFFFS